MRHMARKPYNSAGRTPPRVVVAERVIRKMALGASRYPEEETAEALVGLVIPNEGDREPDLYLLDTIAPDQTAIDRESYMVAQGDDLQDEIMYWLAINWRRFRERRQHSYGKALAGKWDAPLRYLGDWHKQPGEMFWPSHGDLMTALEIVQNPDHDMPQFLAPIVTLAPPWDEAEGPPGDEFDLYARQEDGTIVRINFWYLSRKMKQFVAARPEVQSDQALPAVPPIAWHLTNRARFQEEYDRLVADGLAVSVVEWDADGQPPLEICFLAGRVGGARVYILVTDINYPETPPRVRLAPMSPVEEGEDIFQRLWAESEPLQSEEIYGWTWSPDRMLLDLVHALDAQPSGQFRRSGPGCES